MKGSNQILVVMNDNTLIRQQTKILLESQMQSIFFASIAHDLRTPLNALLASSRSLMMILKKILNLQGQELLDIQMNSIEFLMSLVEDIIDLTKI